MAEPSNGTSNGTTNGTRSNGTRPRSPTRVGVIGTGYVGLTSAVCLASLGHVVHGTDIDPGRVAALRRGHTVLHEPGLPELLADGLDVGRLSFGTDPGDVAGAAVVLLCLPTPAAPDGSADLGPLDSVLPSLRERLAPGAVLVTKSTVPVGTTDRLAQRLGRDDVSVVSNPEFLREAHAVYDFLHPHRIVIGARCDRAGDRVAGLYDGIDAPLVRTDPPSAEMAKYASNAFLGVKASYVNELAALCERVGADIGDVTATMGLDDRIGPAFLSPGPGWGGPCLPKDSRALVRIAADAGMDLPSVREALRTNEHQRDRVLGAVHAATGRPLHGLRVGLLGLAFKAGTADLRDSPALAVADALDAAGAVLTGHDPAVGHADLPHGCPVRACPDPYRMAEDTDAVVVLTEWPAFRDLDWHRMAAVARTPVAVDTRNVLDRDVLDRAGVRLYALGTGAAESRRDAATCSRAPS
ncbi:UDP-glucose/GDP-mannose dehydrogenase family protein [Pseudonocardia sp. KRD291]|uniref:UDP-glucose dehydrogenase family protein n=1 Tax=Pseudonocardia sp. KRD291 TaxID=2792007 RepID=UPI001C49FD44|nr:UDP-glucose/GDP-mannose dehydrogenase family protein [Pseudonocardia sp. KRD291]MBW0101322.1 UDP-glucose/GDP-mannose dehydrogenase family protein [Pseudonocardia sp. KRD291]